MCQSQLSVWTLINVPTDTHVWFKHQTWNNVDGVHHGFDIWQVSERRVELESRSQREVDLIFGKLLDPGVAEKDIGRVAL